MYKYQLEEEMERLRAFMYTKASQLGLNHPTVIQISQRLDELHNQWNREQGLHSKKKRSTDIFHTAVFFKHSGSCTPSRLEFYRNAGVTLVASSYAV